MSRHRSISALLVDVPASHGALLQRALGDAGWSVRAVPVHGPEALSAALQRRGWDAVLYGGEGDGDVPARKALELVRLADPHLPFIAVSPHVRPGELAAVLRGLPGDVPTVIDPANLPATLNRELEQSRLRRRVGGAHRLLAAQQAVADHLAAALDPDTLCDRVLAALGDSLGWTYGAVWRPDGDVLRCASVWQAPAARRPVAGFALAARELAFAPGQGLPGRVWAFRRPAWVAEAEPGALRAGLVGAVAFPLHYGDECAGVIELRSADARVHNAEVAALFASVGAQLGAYVGRRRARRGSFDAAGALLVGLDADGRIELANAAACAALGAREEALLGRDWFAAAVPEAERAAARAQYARLLAGEATGGPALDRTGAVRWRWSPARDAAGAPVGALGWGEA